MWERERKKTIILIIINDKPWYVTQQNFGVLPLSDTSIVENNAPPISFLKQSGKLIANSPNNPSSSHVHADVPIFATYELGQDLLKPATYKYVLCSMMFNEAMQNPIVFAECWPQQPTAVDHKLHLQSASVQTHLATNLLISQGENLDTQKVSKNVWYWDPDTRQVHAWDIVPWKKPPFVANEPMNSRKIISAAIIMSSRYPSSVDFKPVRVDTQAKTLKNPRIVYQ